ncbi:serine hydrolase domain-containing protein [Ferribacterium limneticum]|uniref:serine hydrolase domain-containing protein n=1 Tax=Ferribacterium limneticum TaxID=76259 RepID=UPI001CF90FB4|nr:serine hydrolase domain-containing protein [Ferribacterium limneticum]UCV24821.1 beta-lactamase family protein [Ferribacterium limneticum]
MPNRLASLLVVICLLAGCTTPPPTTTSNVRGDYSHTRKYLSWLVHREMAQNEITGISIALIDDQKVIWQQGFGYADLENKIAATPDTIYRAGSIAKVFTAAAAMQLADEGKLDIDQPLSAALPEFSIKTRFPNAGPVTPRNIMCHHSGLPSNFLQGLFVREPDRFESVVANIRDEYQAFPPNYVFSYSNLGMALLGAAIQKVSGSPFDAYMDRRFFQPLGMNQSSFAPRPIAKAYDRNKEIEVFSLRDMPAANLLSNVVDLSKFMKMQFAEGKSGEYQILSAASTHEMVRIQNKNFPMTFGQYVGLGWMMSGIDVPGGGAVASHGGSLPDSHSMMAILPEHKLGIVILSNSSSSHVAVSKIATEALRLMLEAKTGIRQDATPPARAAERVPTTEELRQFDGNFDTMVGLARISTKNGQIDVEAAGHQFRLVPHEDGLLTIKYRLFGMMAVRVGAFEDIHLSMANVDGRQIIVGRIGAESLIFGEKLKPTKIPERFWNNLGHYEIIGKIDGPTPDRLLLKEDNGLLVGEAHFPEVPDLLLRIAFHAVSDNEVVTAGLGTGRGDTLRLIGAGDEAMLGFSGIQLRKKQN